MSKDNTKCTPIVTIPNDCEGFKKIVSQLFSKELLCPEFLLDLNLLSEYDIVVYPIDECVNRVGTDFSNFLACIGKTVVCLLEIPNYVLSVKSRLANAMLSFFLGEKAELNGLADICRSCKYIENSKMCCKERFIRLYNEERQSVCV